MPSLLRTASCVAGEPPALPTAGLGRGTCWLLGVVPLSCLCCLSVPGAHWWLLLAWRAVAGPHLLPRPAVALLAPQGEQGLGWGRAVRGPKLRLGPPASGGALQDLCPRVLSLFRPCRSLASRGWPRRGLWREGCRSGGCGGSCGARWAQGPRAKLGTSPSWPSITYPCGTGCLGWGVNSSGCQNGGLCRAEEAGGLRGLCRLVFGAGVQLGMLFLLTTLPPPCLSSHCSRAGPFSSRCGVSVPIPVPTQVHNYQRIEQNLQSPTQYQTTR